MSSVETLQLFMSQVELHADPEFGYAATIPEKGSGRCLVKGVGSTPHKAVDDLLYKWEKG